VTSHEARTALPERALAALGATRAGEELGADLPWRDRLLAAAVAAVRVRRFSPADRCPVHRAYPSPDGRFAADLHVRSAAGRLLQVDPHHGVLRGPTPTAHGPADALTAADARLEVTAHPERHPERHPGRADAGDGTPQGAGRGVLALLEAGHLAATVALTASRAGLAPGVDLGPARGTVARVRLDRRPATVDALAVAALDAAAAPSVDTLDTWLDRRASGWSHEDLATSRPVPVEHAVGVAHALERALVVLRDAVPPDGLRPYLTAEAPDGRGVRRLDVPDEPRRPDAAAPAPASVGCTLTVDAARWRERYGAAARVVLPVVLGFVAQWGCLAGAADRLTVRCTPRLDRARWAAALALPPRHVPAYRLRLGAWPPDGDERTAWSLLGVRA